MNADFPDILTSAQLGDLLSSHPLPEELGPGSDRPALVFRLDGAEMQHAPTLFRLPCPVIGIGEGDLQGACDVVLADESRLPSLLARIEAAPMTALILVQHLRSSAELPIEAALTAESMAYATVQFGAEFQAWLATRTAASQATESGPPLLINLQGPVLHLTLNRPAGRNAIGVDMRDALCEALTLAQLDPAIAQVVLRGEGRCFSVGGAIDEFGLASDPATAHWVRSIRLPARHVAALSDKVEVHAHGAVIGAGIEIAAFARRVVAASDAWFQLPEIKYGLIPGAGGTVSIPRRIGRQRAAELMLSGRKISADLALKWGLIDEIW